MSDDRFCRFATKIVCNGRTLVDGVLSVSSLQIMLRGVMHDNALPLMNMEVLYQANEGYHLHYDISCNGGFIGIELSAVSGPVMVEKKADDDAS